MPELPSAATSVETRLEAMDRRLRELQDELAPGPPGPLPAEPESPPAVGAPLAVGGPLAEAGPEPPTAPPAQLEVLAELYGKLIAAVRELLSGYELVAGQLTPTPAADHAPPPEPVQPPQPPSAGADGPDQVAVSAGPFAGNAALRDFERMLSELPGVRAVSLRGYEADNRAIVDVQLQ
jgi:hypothetical protein